MKSLDDIKLEIKREKLEKLKNYKHKIINELIKLYLYEESSRYIDEVFNTDIHDFKTLKQLKCLDISYRYYLIVRVMDQYRRHLDKEEIKEDFFVRVCKRYGLEVEEKTNSNKKISKKRVIKK